MLLPEADETVLHFFICLMRAGMGFPRQLK
jgi:hypothetical protein